MAASVVNIILLIALTSWGVWTKQCFVLFVTYLLHACSILVTYLGPKLLCFNLWIESSGGYGLREQGGGREGDIYGSRHI